MGKTAEEVVKDFMSDTKVRLAGASLKNCLKLAHIIVAMEEDAKLSVISVRNIEHKAKSMEKDKSLSHGTLYNDPCLKEMLHWATAERKPKSDSRAKSDDYYREKSRQLKRQVDTLVKKAQTVDHILNELNDAKINERRNYILLQRALDVLKVHGLTGFFNEAVSPDELAICYSDEFRQRIAEVKIDGGLVQELEVEIDEQ